MATRTRLVPASDRTRIDLVVYRDMLRVQKTTFCHEDKRRLQAMLAEAKNYSLLCNSFITPCIEYWEADGNFVMIMHYHDSRCLGTTGCLDFKSEAELIDFLKDAFTDFARLQYNRCKFRRVSADNLFMNARGRLRFSAFIESEPLQIDYLAPEKYKADVLAFLKIVLSLPESVDLHSTIEQLSYSAPVKELFHKMVDPQDDQTVGFIYLYIFIQTLFKIRIPKTLCPPSSGIEGVRFNIADRHGALGSSEDKFWFPYTDSQDSYFVYAATERSSYELSNSLEELSSSIFWSSELCDSRSTTSTHLVIVPREDLLRDLAPGELKYATPIYGTFPQLRINHQDSASSISTKKSCP